MAEGKSKERTRRWADMVKELRDSNIFDSLPEIDKIRISRENRKRRNRYVKHRIHTM